MANVSAACPKCGKRYRVREEQLGNNARCRQCRSVFPLVADANPEGEGAASSLSAQASADGTGVGADVREGGGRTPREYKSAEEVPAEWQVGDVILDRYEVKAIHRGGAMGLVYRVHHRHWEEDLAVKSPRADRFKTAQHRENFVRECLTWIGLGLHPQVVCCYYVRTLGGIPRVFAEYVSGGSLRDWIDKRKLYEGGPDQALERILDIAIQFAWGLHYAHEKGLIHQDVKPGNVMMTPDGIAKVSDFGLTKARAAAGEEFVPGSTRSILLSSGGMTPAYCSPEQANREKLSRRTDIWSWAASVLEMFTGEVTWMAGQAAAQALESYLDMGVEDDAIPRMPEELVGLLQECFQRDPEGRPEDFGVVAGRLKDMYAEATGRAYAREEPKAATALADALSNQGVSLLDLGIKEEAERKFEEALRADPHHPEATYNQGLLLWRSARMTDDQLIKRLEEVAKSHKATTRDEILLAQVHMERGDAKSAVTVLEGLGKGALKSVDVQTALAWARAGLGEGDHCLRTFEGRSGTLTAIAITPDGRAAVSAGYDKTLRLWDLSTGQCLRTFEGHGRLVTTVAITPDGRAAVSGSDDKTLRLWDLSTGQCLRTFEEHYDKVTAVAITPDGQRAVSGSGSTLQLWDLSTGQCLRKTLEGHSRGVKAVAITPDGRAAVSAGGDNALRVWDLSTGQCLRTFEGHTAGVTAVGITPDGRAAVSGSWDRTLRVWDLSTGRCLRTLEGHSSGVAAVAITPDGRRAVSGSWDHMLSVWDLSTGRCLRTFEGCALQVTAVAITPDGRAALSVSDEEALQLWPLSTGGEADLAETRPTHAEELIDRESMVTRALDKGTLALRRGDVAAALGAAGAARGVPGYERNQERMQAWRRLAACCRTSGLSDAWCGLTFEGHTNRVAAVAITPDGRAAVSGSWDKTLRLWDLRTGHCLRTFEGHNSGVTAVAITPDGRAAVSAGGDKTLRLWDLSTGHCLRTLEGHSSGVAAVAITPDGRAALSASGDETLRLWNLAKGRCRRSFGRHHGNGRIAISPDGRAALSTGGKELRQWELSTGQCLWTLKGHPVEAVAITRDGRSAVSGSWDKTLRLWDLSTGQCLRALEGHTSLVTAVAITPDGRFAVSGSWDRTLRLWDLPTGQCLRTFEGHSGGVTAVAIAPDGQAAVSGSDDKTLRLWELDWDLDFPGWSHWDDGAQPYLQHFLTLRSPTRSVRQLLLELVGRRDSKLCPKWTEDDFKSLRRDLSHAGYGWLRSEGVRKKLEEMAANWKNPPPLPGSGQEQAVGN